LTTFITKIQETNNVVERKDGDDVQPLITLYETTIKTLQDKISATKELIESLDEDVQEWNTELTTITVQLQKYRAQNVNKK
jgi:PIN domain nuclease of toxin-antitoxin system